MKEYVLSYYNNFKCIAKQCKHTCCAGWKIDIDEQSLYNYKTSDNAFSKTLKQGVNFKKSKFKVDKQKRCVFLNGDGLCDIILNLGEKSLCQVCRDHPRFRSFFNDRVETGLGFCCEEATRIILSFNENITPLLISDDKKQVELEFNQKNVLGFREKALNILQDRTVNINNRIDNLLKECKANFNERDFKKILKTFLSFERVAQTWVKRLKNLNKPFEKTTDEQLSLYCEQFLVNSLYRNLSDAEDTMWVRARAISCVFSWWVIKSIIEQERKEEQDLFELVIDVVRSYSVEVEYSQKNLNKLFSFCYKYIKI